MKPTETRKPEGPRSEGSSEVRVAMGATERKVPSGGAWLGCLVMVVASIVGAAEKPRISQPPASRATPESGRPQIPIVLLRGRVVCLPEEMHRRHGSELPSRHEHQWALQSTNGFHFTLLPGRYAAAIFEDGRVRAKELELRVRILPGTQAIEVFNVRSVRGGVVHDLYYYCDVCAIQSVSPEICSCCQGPVELVETPWGKVRE